jgi:hypothetical protein
VKMGRKGGREDGGGVKTGGGGEKGRSGVVRRRAGRFVYIDLHSETHINCTFERFV